MGLGEGLYDELYLLSSTWERGRTLRATPLIIPLGHTLSVQCGSTMLRVLPTTLFVLGAPAWHHPAECIRVQASCVLFPD